MKNFVYLILPIFITSCASIGAVIEGGKDLTTSVVDSTVKTAGNITTAALDDMSGVVNTVAESAENIVDNVVEEIDDQTDALQEPEEDNQEK